MTVMLRPETETLLRERAERAGLDVDTFADTLLTDALADDPDDLTEDEIAEIRTGIRRGYEAGLVGRERSLTEFAADIQLKRAARRTEADHNG